LVNLTFKSLKVAIFIDGEFWHGKDWDTHKSDHKTNQDFWYKKIENDIQRDRVVNTELEKQGWSVLCFWGGDIKKHLLSCILKIEAVIKQAKMDLKEKITLDQIGDKQFKIRIYEPDNNKEAILTHYLHNRKNGVSKFYKKDAIRYTKEILKIKYPEENITNLVAEEALQYNIFETFKIPFPPTENPKFKFIDLFAGIGGFRLAMQNLLGKCVLQVNGIKKRNELIKQILERCHLAILLKKRQNHIFQMILICFVQVSLAKHFQLLVKKAGSMIQEVHYFSMLQK